MVRSVSGMPFNAMRTSKAVTSRNVTSTTYFKGEDKTLNKETLPNSAKVGFWRAAFSRLTNKQIEEANKTGKLSGKVKIKPNGRGGYTIVSNLMGVSSGTQTIPEGFELRKNWLGFTKVLPKDTEGLFIKKK